MKTKFTQGEWKIEHEYNITSENGRSIASAGTYSSNVNPDQVREENIANAKLIAAAPDLLEALIAISTNKHLNLGDLIYDVRERELKGWEGESVKAWSDAVKKVEAAIKKATT